jgi:hypothetical protein
VYFLLKYFNRLERDSVARSAHSGSVTYNWLVFTKLDHEQKTTAMFIQVETMSEITNESSSVTDLFYSFARLWVSKVGNVSVLSKLHSTDNTVNIFCKRKTTRHLNGKTEN